ncbi:Imm57 family immunity protein [Pseudoxanthomonas composti]|uniref:Uncharacterized protein n=1 Tax=Pseudoxanthomonas composti TaxID=2137479 RepID=A0A4Q1JXB2_9GAMM|nr:Imm57 family immunity protein [Pseudoxanthomonas composti]RXR07304.1 hypothetical protein EPA99_05140 [Pseudoxanthomonas composti]
MKNFILIILFFSLMFFLIPAHGGELNNRLARDMEGAEQSILASLVSHRSSGNEYLCAQNLYACTGVDKAELGLSLIGGSRSMAAPRKLLELARFKMDAGLSSDFKCYVSFRGNAVINQVASVDANKLAAQCREELSAFKKRAQARYDVSVEEICRTPSEIANVLRDIKAIAKSGAGCD